MTFTLADIHHQRREAIEAFVRDTKVSLKRKVIDFFSSRKKRQTEWKFIAALHCFDLQTKFCDIMESAILARDYDTCEHCEGTGEGVNPDTNCFACKGKGYHPRREAEPDPNDEHDYHESLKDE